MQKFSITKKLEGTLSDTELKQLIQILKEEPNVLLSELISLKKDPVDTFVKDISLHLNQLINDLNGKTNVDGSLIRDSRKFTHFEYRILSFTIQDIEAILVQLLTVNKHIVYVTFVNEFLLLLQGYLNQSKFSTLMQNNTLSTLYNS